MLILLIVLLLIAPVKLTLIWDQGLTVVWRIWGLGRTSRADLSPTGQSTPHQQFMRLLGAFLRSDKARRFFLRRIQVVRLQALLHLGMNDAGLTAVFSGLLQQLSRLLPRRADVRIQPDFLAPTRLQARCILFLHLGTIIITAVMVITAYLLEAREHPLPHPKEA